MMLHKHALQKGKVTSPVISLPLSYRVIDCLLRTADQEKCPPQEGGSVEFQKRPKTHQDLLECPYGNLWSLHIPMRRRDI